MTKVIAVVHSEYRMSCPTKSLQRIQLRSVHKNKRRKEQIDQVTDKNYFH